MLLPLVMSSLSFMVDDKNVDDKDFEKDSVEKSDTSDGLRFVNNTAAAQ